MTGGRTEDRMLAALNWWTTRAHTGPTSSIIGCGAVVELERWFAALHQHRRAYAVGSGTMALLAAFLACGVEHGQHVVLPERDWTASRAIARMLGAQIHLAGAGPRGVVTAETVDRALPRQAVIACIVSHLGGEVADTTSIRKVLPPGTVVIDDVSQSLGIRGSDSVCGTEGDLTCASLCHGKRIDAGEGGLVSARRSDLADAVLRCSQHPVRQANEGVSVPNTEVVVSRMHPTAAMLALWEIERSDFASVLPC